MDHNYDYSYEWDSRYCYPNSNVLKNKLGITDADEFHFAEREIVSFREATLRIYGLPGTPGKFDFKYLQKIHKYLFDDVYDWAGKIRQVDISKGNVFCHFAYIPNQADKVFAELKNENFLKDTDIEAIPKRLSYYLSEINVLHPFREGNGRTQRAFIELLAKERGFMVDFSKIDPKDMIVASAESFYCNYDKMDAIFQKITSPLPPEVLQQMGKNSSLKLKNKNSKNPKR